MRCPLLYNGWSRIATEIKNDISCFQLLSASLLKLLPPISCLVISSMCLFYFGSEDVILVCRAELRAEFRFDVAAINDQNVHGFGSYFGPKIP